MATQAKTYLDLAGLTTYNEKIKEWSNSANQVAYKTVIKSTDGNSLYFYKKANAVLGTDTPDATIALGGGDSTAKFNELADKIGATWSGNTLNLTDFATGISATTLVGAINEVWTDINTFVGEIPSGATATTVIGYAAEIAAAEADAAETAAKNYTDAEIAKLDADVDASGTAQHSGTFVVSGVTEVDGVITGVDSVEVEAAGAAAALDAQLAAVAKSGDADDVAYDNTTSHLTATDIQGAIDEIKGGLGTAAAADVATSAIQEKSTDDSLVSAAQVATFIAAEIAGLEGAMHFRGIITRQTGETDAQAIARVIKDPEAGDVVVMSDNAKEYIYDAATGTPSWREVGDETEFVKKTTTIAGVDLQDNITKSELLTALNVEDGAEVNIIESVQVNGSALTPDANRAVNVTVAEGATNGTVAVNGSDVAVHGLGSAAYTDSTAYDAAGTAAGLIANLDTSSDVAIASNNSSTGAVTFAGSIAETNGIIGAGSADNVIFTPITTAEINALFA